MSVRKRTAAKATKATAASAPKPRAAAQPRATVAGVGSAPAPSTPIARVLDPIDPPAPVVVPDDDDGTTAPEAPALAVSPALVFPTDEHWAEIRAGVLAADPSLATASERAVNRAMQDALPAHVARLHERARRSHVLVQLAAPVFPTESHIIALNAAIPNLTTEEQTAVVNAGHAAYVASVAAGEPITEVPAA